LTVIYLCKQKLLFLKPKKSAGTSVEIALSCNAGPDDIVTPILPEDERKRYELGGQFPVNWAWQKSAEEQYRNRFNQYLKDGTVAPRWFGLKRGRLYARRAAKFVNHIPPNLVKRRAENNLMENAFFVTMCRHPYETVFSWASHLHADNGVKLQKLIEMASRHAPLNEVYLFSERQPDFVIRYEYLHEDLAELEARFGLSLVERLPLTKAKARTDRRPAAEILSDEQKARIRKSHCRTFEMFGYEP
jgi:hypothetical protein